MAEKVFSSFDLEKLLTQEGGYNNFCFLNSNGAPAGSYCGLSKYDYLAGINSLDEITVNENSLQSLDSFIKLYKNKIINYTKKSSKLNVIKANK